MSVSVPKHQEFMNPIIQALKVLGGSASINELYDRVVDDMKLSDDVLEIMHKGSSTTTEVAYRMAWARTYLKIYGAITNSQRAIWSLTSEYANVDSIDPRKVTGFVNAKKAEKKKETGTDDLHIEPEKEIEEPQWRIKLKQVLLSMSSDAFERLTQRILRESGFSQVEVTGKSGDGGIDGKGILKINGLMAFT